MSTNMRPLHIKNYEYLLAQNLSPLIKRNLLFERTDLPVPAATCSLANGKRLFLYNPQILNTLPIELLPDIASHEYYHDLHNHITIPNRQMYDAARLLQAADCEVNSFLKNLQIEPFVFPRRFNLPDFRTWNWYYKHLSEKKTSKPETNNCTMSLPQETLQKLQKELQVQAKKYGTNITVREPPVTYITAKKSSLRSKLERFVAQYDDTGVCQKSRLASMPHKWKENFGGKRRTFQPKLLFAIDCSGSTCGEQLHEYYTHTKDLLKEYSATIVEFSDKIHHIGKTLTFQEWGGGTNFECIAQFDTEQGPFDAIIWFTDGEGELQHTRSKSYYFLTNRDKLNSVKLFGKILNE